MCLLPSPPCYAGEQTPDGPVPEWHITDIVSQTDVLRFLAARIDKCACTTACLGGMGICVGCVLLSVLRLDSGLHAWPQATPEHACFPPAHLLNSITSSWPAG